MIPEQIKIEFTKEKETKNTIRFKEEFPEDYHPVVTTLYVQKWALDESFGKIPEKITITIEVANENKKGKTNS